MSNIKQTRLVRVRPGDEFTTKRNLNYFPGLSESLLDPVDPEVFATDPGHVGQLPDSGPEASHDGPGRQGDGVLRRAIVGDRRCRRSQRGSGHQAGSACQCGPHELSSTWTVHHVPALSSTSHTGILRASRASSPPQSTVGRQ